MEREKENWIKGLDGLWFNPGARLVRFIKTKQKKTRDKASLNFESIKKKKKKAKTSLPYKQSCKICINL